MVVREHGSYTASRLHQNGAAAAGAMAPGADDPMLTDMMDYYFVRKTESYKFIRMADDLHDVASYLNEMRICFLLLTGTVYLILAIYFVNWCIRRNRRRVNNPAGAGRRLPNHRWGELQGNEYENAITAQTNVGQTAATEDLVSVRSDGALPPGKVGQVGAGAMGASQFGMAGRAANRQAAPTFMRHSAASQLQMQNHSGGSGGGSASSAPLLGSSATTRLLADTDTGTATMQIGTGGGGKPSSAISPHLSTSPSPGQHHHQQQQQQMHHAAHHHHVQAVHQQQQGEQQQPQQQTGPTGGRSPGCLLNNIVEEKEAASGSNSASSSTAGTMSTFGWRNKEKLVLDRHELQSMSDNV